MTDIEVDVSAENSVEAQRQAFAEARLVAARQLVSRLTFAEDRARIGGVQVDGVTAARLAAAVDVQEQKRSGTRYFGILSVKFDPAAVRGYLQALDLPYTESAAAKAVLAPIAGPGADVVSWIGAWSGLETDHGLIPFGLGYGVYDSSSTWDEFMLEAETLNATRAVLARAEIQNGAIYVRITELRPDGQVSRLGRAGPYASLEEAAPGTLAYLRGDWKRRTTVRGGDKTGIDAVATFSSLREWVAIKSALSASRLVTDFRVRSVTNSGADVGFVYSGRPDQLAAELRALGVNFLSDDLGWTLEAVGVR
ncbi:MAG: hypothetical protein AAF719_13035 [Pseudomonadota bacterium]